MKDNELTDEWYAITESEEEGCLSNVSSVAEVSRHLVANSLSPNSSDNKRRIQISEGFVWKF